MFYFRLIDVSPVSITKRGDERSADDPPIERSQNEIRGGGLMCLKQYAMTQLPNLNLRAEREQLAQLMCKPFHQRSDYQQTRQSFHDFVQGLRASNVMRCLEVLKA